MDLPAAGFREDSRQCMPVISMGQIPFGAWSRFDKSAPIPRELGSAGDVLRAGMAIFLIYAPLARRRAPSAARACWSLWPNEAGLQAVRRLLRPNVRSGSSGEGFAIGKQPR